MNEDKRNYLILSLLGIALNDFMNYFNSFPILYNIQTSIKDFNNTMLRRNADWFNQWPNK